MCAVSAVTDYGMRNWPGVLPQTSPWFHQTVFPPRQPTIDEMRELVRLHDAAKEFDAKTHQPHCEDPDKSKFWDAINERLARIEDHLKLEQPS